VPINQHQQITSPCLAAYAAQQTPHSFRHDQQQQQQHNKVGLMRVFVVKHKKTNK
jgi:hypothetical protein